MIANDGIDRVSKEILAQQAPHASVAN
jgi:hypothetical protein